VEAARKTVVVTGASSGIGRATALELERRGFLVFAGVRRPVDGEALRAEGRGAIVPIEIDVTDERRIALAAAEIEARLGNGRAALDGLVNNAGIGTAGPVEYISEQSLRRQFEVNVFGQIAVIQAFLPFIRRARGRIVNIGSVGSHIGLPFGGVLCASKAAFSILSDTLRLELRRFGIHVILIEPAAIRTPAVEKTLGNAEAIVAALPPEGAVRYGADIREFVRRSYALEMRGSPPEVVAKVVHRALTARRPRLRYIVGKDARVLATLPRLLPERLLDRVRLRMLGLTSATAQSR
jgi:NAD(P)-dependent dehydrogenase (short-subunit alcohol dehydrogenase family)